MTLEIFVSSSCYELRDLRASIKAFLEGLGIEPMLSDDKGFPRYQGLKPYVSCLKVLEDCPMAIGVIERHYGAKFADWAPYPQYAELSPIHAELRHALAVKKRLLLYVHRDTLAVYEQWRKNRESFEGIDLQNGLSKDTLLLIAELKRLDPAPWIESYEDVTSILQSLKKVLVTEIYQSLMEQKRRDEDAAQYLLKKIFELAPEVRNKVEAGVSSELVTAVGELKAELVSLEAKAKTEGEASKEVIARLNEEKTALADKIRAKEAEVAAAKFTLLLAATKDAGWLKLIRTRLMDKQPGRVPFHNDQEVALRGYHCTNLRDAQPKLTRVTWEKLPPPEGGLYRGYKTAVVFYGAGFAPGVVWATRSKGSGGGAAHWQQPSTYFGDYLEVSVNEDPFESPLSYKNTEFCVRNPNGKSSEWVGFSYPFDMPALEKILADNAVAGKKLLTAKQFKEAVEPLRKAYVFSDRINGGSHELTRELCQLHETALDQKTLVGLRFQPGTKVRVVAGVNKGREGVIELIKTRCASPYQIKDGEAPQFFAADAEVELDEVASKGG